MPEFTFFLESCYERARLIGGKKLARKHLGDGVKATFSYKERIKKAEVPPAGDTSASRAKLWISAG
jgi:hypothetical protein